MTNNIEIISVIPTNNCEDSGKLSNINQFI